MAISTVVCVVDVQKQIVGLAVLVFTIGGVRASVAYSTLIVLYSL